MPGVCGVSRITRSPVMTAARERVVGMPERRDRLADNVFAQHRNEARHGHRPAARGVGWIPRVECHGYARRRSPLRAQDGPAVPESRHEMTELMAGIGHRNRVRCPGPACAGENLGLPPGSAGPIRIEAEMAGERPVQFDQSRRSDRRWRDPREKSAGSAA